MYCLRLRDFRFNLVRNIAPIFPPVNSSTSFAACGERLADIDATYFLQSNPDAPGDLIRPIYVVFVRQAWLERQEARAAQRQR